MNLRNTFADFRDVIEPVACAALAAVRPVQVHTDVVAAHVGYEALVHVCGRRGRT